MRTIEDDAHGLSEDAEAEPEDDVPRPIVFERSGGPIRDPYQRDLKDDAEEGPKAEHMARYPNQELVEDGTDEERREESQIAARAATSGWVKWVGWVEWGGVGWVCEVQAKR